MRSSCLETTAVSASLYQPTRYTVCVCVCAQCVYSSLALAILNSTWRVRADNLGMGNMKRGDGYMDAFEPVISQIPWLPVRI